MSSPPPGVPDAAPARPARYRVEERLGAGASAEVYAVTDVELDRGAAMKILHADVASDAACVELFLAEARLTAALEHPHVLPVHDLDRAPDGRPFFIMKRVEGISLAEAIAGSSALQRHPRIADINDVVTVFIAVGQALAFAHARDIRHHDIKPGNLMLGRFGEAVLADWGSAGRTRIASHGTPLYASPEQLRGEPVDGRSDLYAFGATLFEALLLRPPLPDDGMAAGELVRRRSLGELLPPDAAERRRVPAALLAIALKALDPDPAGRYADAPAMLADLRAFQAGLAVAAHPEPLHRRLARWLRRHARELVAAAAALALVLALVLALIGERLKERATWGAPVFTERFGEGWQARWRVVHGGFVAVAGGVRSTAARRNILASGQRCDGDTAIEVRARVAEDAVLGDLAIGWAREPIRSAADVTWRCAMGEWDGRVAGIRRDDLYVARNEQLRQVRGHSYRLRIEVVADQLTLLVDGRTVCRYAAPFPLTGGYFALFAFHPGKVFEDVAVFPLGTPERLPGTAVGDAFAALGDYPHAIEDYARVSASHARTAMGEQALLRSGLCRLRLGDGAAARADFAGLTRPDLVLLAALELGHRAAPDDDEAFAQACGRACASGDAGLVDRVAQYWCERVLARIGRSDATALERYLDLQQRLLPDHPLARSVGADAALSLGRFADLIARFPEQPPVVDALMALGRVEEALERFRDAPIQERWIMRSMGRWEEYRRRAGVMASLDPTWCMLEEGRAEEALALGGERQPVLLMATGRFEEAARLARNPDLGCRIALLAGGGAAMRDDPSLLLVTRLLMAMARRQLPESLALAANVASHREWPRLLAGVRAARAGDAAAAAAFFAADDALAHHQQKFTFGHFVIAPVVRTLLGGDARALPEACERAVALGRHVEQQRPWYRAAYLLGRCDRAAFLAQPHRVFARADLLLLDAVRDDLAGAPGAAAGYSAYLALPRHQRGSDIDPVLEEFAEWRAGVRRGAVEPPAQRR